MNVSWFAGVVGTTLIAWGLALQIFGPVWIGLFYLSAVACGVVMFFRWLNTR